MLSPSSRDRLKLFGSRSGSSVTSDTIQFRGSLDFSSSRLVSMLSRCFITQSSRDEEGSEIPAASIRLPCSDSRIRKGSQPAYSAFWQSSIPGFLLYYSPQTLGSDMPPKTRFTHERYERSYLSTRLTTGFGSNHTTPRLLTSHEVPQYLAHTIHKLHLYLNIHAKFLPVIISIAY